MKRTTVLVLMLCSLNAIAQNNSAKGTITYLASGTVYTSLGREQGLQDSSLLIVPKGSDTLALLKVYAVSSKSSACTIVRSRRTLVVGDIVLFSPLTPKKTEPVTIVKDTAIVALPMDSTAFVPAKREGPKEKPWMSFQGRTSIQYLTTRYDLADNNFSQPQIVLNARGKLRDVPLTFEMYSYVRSLATGQSKPFSSSSVNQSKVYRFMLQYDDGQNTLSVGRFIPLMASGIGYLDGMMLSHKFGEVTFGSSFGYQPLGNLQNVSTAYKKVALFGGFQQTGSMNILLSTAYYRTYYYRMLNREAFSTQLSLYSLSGLSIYANSEVDLRRKIGDQFSLSPSVTNMFFNISYPLAQWISASVGSNVSRPFSEYDAIRFTPDTLLDTKIRGGVNFGITLSLVRGVMLMNTYSPRSSDAGFANEYSNASTLVFNDLLSTGVSVRTSYTLNRNENILSNGFGVYLHRNIGASSDVSLYLQNQRYSISSIADNNTSKTLGADVVLYLSSQFSLIGSYNRFNGYGSVSNTIFSELSFRF